MKIEDLNNRKVAILGFGKEGKSSLNFLLKLNIDKTYITVLDKNIITTISNVKTISGNNYLDDLNNYDFIIKSPGISPYTIKELKKYRGIITSQAQIFFDNYNRSKVIGITGTKGKSTISTLVYKTIKTAGFNVKLVGNIGNPVLDEIDILSKNTKYDYIVYELSSYMLEGLTPKLYIGVLNNIYDCHLDWHDGRNNYQKSKLNILNAEYTLISSELYESKILNNIEINQDTNYYFGESGKYYFDKTKQIFFNGNKELFIDKKIELKGNHNRKNISAVIGICDIIGIDYNILYNVLTTFSGLPHRIEKIAEINGIIFIDDAIATTPESTIAAIKTFGTKIGTLLLGGQNSGFDFEKLIKVISEYKIKNLVLFPDTGINIYDEIINQNIKTQFNILKTSNMKNAIDFAYKNTEKGKICLLSNASPSFSLWSGYIEKGQLFKKEVLDYKKN